VMCVPWYVSAKVGALLSCRKGLYNLAMEFTLETLCSEDDTVATEVIGEPKLSIMLAQYGGSEQPSILSWLHADQS
jgi:hypothetical protein